MAEITSRKAGYGSYAEESPLDFDFTMAFQPIVDIARQKIFGHEALARGLGGEGAASVLEHVNASNQYQFDQMSRVKAIQLAAILGLDSYLSINFMPNAVYDAQTCISSTLEAAATCKFPLDRLIFEITETEKVEDIAHLREIVHEYKELGFKTAIDDFGAGHSGLHLLAEICPDYIKIDMSLIRNIDKDRTRQSIAKGILHVSRDLGLTPIAEGIETTEELTVVRDLGIELCQGYYFAKPAFRALAAVTF